MIVKDVVTPDPYCVPPNTSLAKAAQLMKLLDVGMLPVCENDRIAGVVTDRDITIRGVAVGMDPNTAIVRQVMTPDVIWCFEEQSLREAANTMEEYKVRRLPVMNEQKRLVGIVSLGDLALRTHKEKLVGEILERISEPAPAY